MDDLPFSISDDAAAWIQETIRAAEEDPLFVAGLIPVLSLYANHRGRDEEGQIVEVYSGEFFDVGWFPPEAISDNNLFSANMLGSEIFIIPDILEILNDKQLVLETVEVGFPNPTERVARLLLAR